MLIFLLAITLLYHRADAIPITSLGPPTSPTILHTIAFGITSRTACSDIRSIYDIVRSCFFTIAACVYRAIHPNIPDPDASLWRKIKVTAKITVYALIAPEVMIIWAMRQRFGAKTVAAGVNKLHPELKWTQTHGQFAQMGGFGRKDTKHVLYPPTLIKLLKSGQLDIEELQLTQKEINDKSKGDILSKGIVAFQTTWFLFECIVRLKQGLPIVELEVVTLAFATLNAVTYAVWWYKPLNVVCPIYLHVRPPPSTLDSGSPTAGIANKESPVEDGQDEAEEPLISGEASGRDEVEMVQVQANTVMVKKKQHVGKRVQVAVFGVIEDIKKDVKDEGWLYTAAKWLLKEPFVAVVWPLWELLRDEGVDDDATHVSVFYAMTISVEEEDWVMIPAGLIGMVFGAIHFISWDSTFPNHLQLLLWRISSIIMVAQPFFFLVSDSFSLTYNKASSGSLLESAASYFSAIFDYVVYIGTVPYIFSRFCVLVLAFLTLRDLPSDAFTNISWTTYIPHF